MLRIVARHLPRGIALLSSALLGAALFAAGGGGGGGGSENDAQKNSGPYKDAVTAIQANDYPKAITLLEPWVLANAGDADGHNWLAYAYRKTGKLDLAFRHYRRALGIDPQHKGAHEYIGEAYLMANQPDKAEQHAKTLAGLCPQGCEELTDLRAAITAHRAKNGATAKAP
ncbi:MAG TPA: tetratricopeptide repeat protein [Burkholderiaceae bacterium]